MLDKWSLQFFVIMQIFVVNKCVVFHFRKSLMEIFLSSTHKSFLQKEKFRKDIKGLVLTCTRYVSFWSRSTLINCTSAQANFLKLKSKQKVKRHTIFQFSL